MAIQFNPKFTEKWIFPRRERKDATGPNNNVSQGLSITKRVAVAE